MADYFRGMMHRHLAGYRALALLCVLLLLAGCGKEAALPALSPDGVILAFGDSLTYGTGAKPNESYPAALERLAGLRVVNAGIPGEESDAGLARLGGVLAEVQPDLVILGHGGNDLLRKRDLAQTRSNLSRMVALARDQGASVVLLGIPKPGIFLGTHSMYSELAESLGLPLEADALAEILGDASLKSDAIHPDAAGYQALAQAVHRLLIRSGAL